MGKVILQYTAKDANDLLEVNTSPRLEIFHTGTFTTGTGSASDVNVAVGEQGGFDDGDSVYVGTNGAETVSDAGLPADGAGTITLGVAPGAWANNAPFILKRESGQGADAYADIFDDPDYSTSIQSNFPWTADSNNEWEFYARPGLYFIRYSDSNDVTLRVDSFQVFEASEAIHVTPGHASRTAGIQEAIARLPSGGGEVYLNHAVTISFGITLVSNLKFRMGPKGKITASTTIASGSGMIVIPAAGVSNVILEDLILDGDAANQGTDTVLGIGTAATGEANDITIRNCRVENMTGVGIDVGSAGGGGSNRVHIHNNTVKDIGRDGIEVVDCRHFEITNNIVISTGDHGIAATTGTTGNTQFCRDGIITGNVVDRTTAPTQIAGGAAEAGGIITIGHNAMWINVSDNICRGNVSRVNDSTVLAGDGIQLSIVLNEDTEEIVIDGNVVTEAGGFGIDVPGSAVCTNNFVSRSGTHGISCNGEAAQVYSSVVISHNIVEDVNERNTLTSVFCIRIDPKSNSIVIENVEIHDNVCRDTRGTPRTASALAIQTSTTGPIKTLSICNNNFRDAQGGATSDAIIAWTGKSITNLRVRNNQMPNHDPYMDVAYLTADGTAASTTAGTRTVTNIFWPGILNTRFHISRCDLNSSTSVGSLVGVYNSTSDTFTISARNPSDGAVLTQDSTGVLWEFVGTED